MMYTDVFGVMESPRPTAICSVRDLLIPSPAALGALVLSMSCAGATSGKTRVRPVKMHTVERTRCVMVTLPGTVASGIRSCIADAIGRACAHRTERVAIAAFARGT